jgi:hypothetical protein
VVRPARFELPPFWFVARVAQNLTAFSGVAYERKTPFTPSQLSVTLCVLWLIRYRQAQWVSAPC